MPATHRLTLVACGEDHRIDWEAALGVAFLNGDALGFEIVGALNEPTLDVERLIIDRTATAEEFLEVLAGLPGEFSGDVLHIDDRGRGFLSTAGRGGDRLMYRLAPEDVRFYVTTLRLITEHVEKVA